MREVIVFGSTGSIGKNTLEVLKLSNEFFVKGLCAYKNINFLQEQIKSHKPKYVCVINENAAKKMPKNVLRGCKFFYGDSGLKEFAAIPSDLAVMAISGISSLTPILMQMPKTKRIALANKESVVTAGKFIFNYAKDCKTEIVPVDSEINSLFQLLVDKKKDVKKVYLTASGGSLFGFSRKQLAKVKVKNVLAHPTWVMGKRITVDSATLVNKAFEVIETHFFFGFPYQSIDVLLHRESIVHALVEYCDYSFRSVLYSPDMRIPILSAISYPDNFNLSEKGNSKYKISIPEINFNNNLSLSFKKLGKNVFPLYDLVVKAADKDDNLLVILNACDEVAIDYFLKNRISFLDIEDVMFYMAQKYPKHKLISMDDLFFWDQWARVKTKEYLDKLN